MLPHILIGPHYISKFIHWIYFTGYICSYCPYLSYIGPCFCCIIQWLWSCLECNCCIVPWKQLWASEALLWGVNISQYARLNLHIANLWCTLQQRVLVFSNSTRSSLTWQSYVLYLKNNSNPVTINGKKQLRITPYVKSNRYIHNSYYEMLQIDK